MPSRRKLGGNGSTQEDLAATFTAAAVDLVTSAAAADVVTSAAAAASDLVTSAAAAADLVSAVAAADLVSAVAAADLVSAVADADLVSADSVGAPNAGLIGAHDVSPTDADVSDLEVLQKHAQLFVHKFYDIFNSDPTKIHELYASNGHLVLTIHLSHLSREIRTAKAIKEFWASFREPLMTCRAYCFVAQQKGDDMLIVVNGKCRGFGTRSSNFVEALLLNNIGKILHDVLFVFEDGKPIRITEDERELIPAENLNVARRRSARIQQNSRLRSGQRPEAEQSVKVGVKSGRGAGIRQQAVQKRPEAELSVKVGVKSRRDAGIRQQAVQKDVKISLCAEEISVAILYDKVMLGHRPDFYCLTDDDRMISRKSKCNHVEKPERISRIMKRLIEDRLFDRAVHVRHDPATVQDVMSVHQADYVGFIGQLPLTTSNIDQYVGFYSKDMYCSVGTRDAIYSAVGATMKACDVVIRGLFKTAFAIVRPPGHHAGSDEAEGFCYVNNVAVAVDYLKRVHGIKKKLVVDWDAHHGNGTEELFYSTDEVLFFNIFNVDLQYPVTTKLHAEHIGRGKGAGYNVNIPLHSGFGDCDMIYIWKHLLLPLIREYCPDITVISCGFDSAKGDRVGGALVTAPCYATLLDMIVEAGNGKVVLSLEGGYTLRVVENCASHCVRAMVGDRQALLADNMDEPPLEDTIETVEVVKHNIARFWDVFKQKPKRKSER